MRKEAQKFENKGDGSFDAHIAEARVYTQDLPKDFLKGIGEAGKIAKAVEGLGEFAQKYPELRHWADRQLNVLKAMSVDAEKGKKFDKKVGQWNKGVEDALSNWKGPREDMEFYDTTMAGVKAIGLLHTAIRNTAPVGGSMEDINIQASVGRGTPHKEALRGQQNVDLERLGRLEEEVVTGKELDLYGLRTLCNAYAIKVPLELSGERPGNIVRKEILEEKGGKKK